MFSVSIKRITVIDYVLGLNLNFQPGTGYNYNDGDPQVVSGIVQAATGKTLDEYGKEVLFDPLGITNYKWDRYSDGVTLGGFGITDLPEGAGESCPMCA